MTTRPRVVMIGLDGATFSLLDAYATRGVMPAWGRWRREGSGGPLASTNPPTTPPAWSSCVTGKNPGKHGVFDFRESISADRRRPLVTGRSIRARTLWEMIGDGGRRACIVNFPVSWPAEPMCGTMITGMLTPDGGIQNAWPEEEGEALRQAVPGYLWNVDIPRYDVDQPSGALRFLDDLERSLDGRIAAFRHFRAREAWDLLFVTFVFHDRIGHLFWKLVQDGEGLLDHPQRAVVRQRVEAMYRRFDALLDELMDRRAPEETLLIVSDHGFGSTHGFFEVNSWLMEEGLLVLRPGARLRTLAFATAMEMGEHPAVRRVVPSGLQATIRGRIRSGRSSFKSDLEDAVDWERTRAFFPSVACQGIHVLRREDGFSGGVSGPAELRQVRDQIEDRLRTVRDEQGAPIIDAVWDRETLFSGPYAAWGPDLVFRAQGHACVGRPLLSARRIVRDARDTPNGFHRTDGVFMALGEGVLAGASVLGARIEDVTPTVLWALGEPLPDDMDGRVLQEGWDEAWRRAHPVRWREAPVWKGSAAPAPEGDQGALAERLRRLGYLD